MKSTHIVFGIFFAVSVFGCSRANRALVVDRVEEVPSEKPSSSEASDVMDTETPTVPPLVPDGTVVQIPIPPPPAPSLPPILVRASLSGRPIINKRIDQAGGRLDFNRSTPITLTLASNTPGIVLLSVESDLNDIQCKTGGVSTVCDFLESGKHTIRVTIAAGIRTASAAVTLDVGERTALPAQHPIYELWAYGQLFDERDSLQMLLARNPAAGAPVFQRQRKVMDLFTAPTGVCNQAVNRFVVSDVWHGFVPEWVLPAYQAAVQSGGQTFRRDGVLGYACKEPQTYARQAVHSLRAFDRNHNWNIDNVIALDPARTIRNFEMRFGARFDFSNPIGGNRDLVYFFTR